MIWFVNQFNLITNFQIAREREREMASCLPLYLYRSLCFWVCILIGAQFVYIFTANRDTAIGKIGRHFKVHEIRSFPLHSRCWLRSMWSCVVFVFFAAALILCVSLSSFQGDKLRLGIILTCRWSFNMYSSLSHVCTRWTQSLFRFRFSLSLLKLAAFFRSVHQHKFFA